MIVPRMSTPFSDPLSSPCVRNCCLDEDNICMGCGRSLEEIVQWGTASDADKSAILARSRERLGARPILSGRGLVRGGG
jgi:predicted Fe-S protein YdhL (DUF1289 family)